MKVRVFIPVLALSMLALQGCLKEKESASEKAAPQMTIRVSIPEDATKAGFTVPGSGEGLHLAWKDGDVIRVISGANSAVYDIQPGFTDHEASFTGPEVAGDSYDIVVPGTYTSAAEAEEGDANLTQSGNGSTEHLVFTAKLTGVAKADLPEIGFTSDWVTAHAGTELKRGGIVKMTLTLPNAVTAPKKVVLKGLGDDIAVNVTGVSLASEHVLTVYAQSGWDDGRSSPLTLSMPTSPAMPSPRPLLPTKPSRRVHRTFSLSPTASRSSSSLVVTARRPVLTFWQMPSSWTICMWTES